MFAFTHPQKKEPKMNVIFHNDNSGKWFSISTPYKELSLGESDARELAYKILTHIGDIPPLFSPPDPALLLAQRIARIATETGLKPRLVYLIVNQVKWDTEQAKEAAAPQENHTDA